MLPIVRRFPLLAAILAAVAMISITAWQAYLFWQEAGQPARHAGTRALAVQQADTPAVPQPDWQTVPLFGNETEDAVETLASTENLPATNLRLYLRGVLAAEGDFPGSALVEDDKGRTEVYLIGDELPGNARLHAVFPTRVVLERSGKLENLYFPDPETRSALAVPASAAQQPAAVTPPAPAATGVAQDPSREQSRREEIRRRLELLRERLRQQN